MREIRRRTRVVGNFPDGGSALMLVAARLRHISSTKWSSKQYLNMKRMAEMQGLMAPYFLRKSLRRPRINM